MFLPSLLLRSGVANYSEDELRTCFALLLSSRWTQAFAIFLSILPIMSSFQLLWGRLPNSVEKKSSSENASWYCPVTGNYFAFFSMATFSQAFWKMRQTLLYLVQKNHRSDSWSLWLKCGGSWWRQQH